MAEYQLSEALRLAVIPWLAFELTLASSVVWRPYNRFSWLGLALSAPGYLVFVGLPAWAPIAVSTSRATRRVVLTIMTATSACAAYLILTTEDAQAGLAVLIVWYVAIPLLVVVVAGQAVVDWMSRR